MWSFFAFYQVIYSGYLRAESILNACLHPFQGNVPLHLKGFLPLSLMCIGHVSMHFTVPAQAKLKDPVSELTANHFLNLRLMSSPDSFKISPQIRGFIFSLSV